MSVAEVLNRLADRLDGDGSADLKAFEDGSVGAYGPDDKDWSDGPFAPVADVVTALRRAATASTPPPRDDGRFDKELFS